MNVEARQTPDGDYAARQIIGDLFRDKITPTHAAGRLETLFRKQGLDSHEAYERVRMQHSFFQDENFPRMTQAQSVNWDNVVIMLEEVYKIPEEEKASRYRLVPIGTPSVRQDLEDLAF